MDLWSLDAKQTHTQKNNPQVTANIFKEYELKLKSMNR